MKICAKTDYACRALLELSLHWPNITPLRLNDIAHRQQIPLKFLIHILISLKQLGYIESLRGNKGGYVLAKSPKEILLKDVIEHFEHHPFYQSAGTKAKKGNVFEKIWTQVNKAVVDQILAINYEEICNQEKTHDTVPMYNI